MNGEGEKIVRKSQMVGKRNGYQEKTPIWRIEQQEPNSLITRSVTLVLAARTTKSKKQL